MPSRELTFAEFKKRLANEGETVKPGGLWNELAGCVIGFYRPHKSDKPAECTLPVDKLLALLPAEFQKLPGVARNYTRMYKALHQSLKENPDELWDQTLALSREGFVAFAAPCSPKEKAFVSIAFGGLPYYEGDLTLERLEAFCKAIKSSKERRRGFSEKHLRLLDSWLMHLKKHR